jgi:hypothetical protein
VPLESLVDYGACGFPAHSLTMIFLVWLSSIAHCALQSIQIHRVELLLGPTLLPRHSLPAAPILPTFPARIDGAVQLVELPIGIAASKVIPPAAKHGIQFRDDLFTSFPFCRLDLPDTGR